MTKTLVRSAQVVFVALLVSFTSSRISVPVWNIDTNHSKIGFEVNHFFTPVEGYFKDFEGELKFDPDDLKGSSINFTIQVASIKTNSDRRDNHLKSGDFFNVEKYPVMKFVSTSISKTDDSYVAKGNLTIKDVSKSVEITFHILGIGDHPMKKGNKIISIKGGLKINRSDYGVGTGSWAATVVVGEEVTIEIVIEATRKG